MSVKKIEALSPEMKRDLKFVKIIAKRMKFDENIGNVNWKSMRAFSEFGYRFLPKEKNVSFKKVRLGNTNAILSVPKELKNNDVIMHIHGGGFVSGSAASSKGYCSMAAKYFGSMVYSVDYPLSPESPYPNAVNTCFAAYREIMKLHPDADITLIGESAGGNLCLVTALKAMAEKIKKPQCVIVHSPTVDFSGSLKRENEINDIFVKKGCLKPLSEMYVGKNDPKNYEISPIYGDFTDFPPLIITCDVNETLFADSLALYDKALENNVKVMMYQFKNTFHAAGILGTGSPETKKLLEENTEFVKQLK